MGLPVILATSNKTIKVLEAQIYCFNRFWPRQRVFVLGYDSPRFSLPDNFYFNSLGIDPGPSKWSNGIKKWIKQNAPKYFIFSVDDMLPITKVNSKLINKLSDIYCNDNLGRLGLTKDIVNRSHTSLSKDGSVILARPNAKYRVSTLFSIWRKKAFLKAIKDDMSAWEFEKKGNVESLVIGTSKKYPIHNSHGLYSKNIPQHNWKKCVCCNIRPDAKATKVLERLL